MWARLALAATADVAAAAAVAGRDSRRGGGSGEWLRSEAFLSQVGLPNSCLHPKVRGSCRGMS